MVDAVGRLTEIETLGEMLDDRATPVVIVEGEAGIGKTTVWRAVLERAGERGGLVLRCASAEPEMGLSYAALGDLVGDVFAGLRDELHSPQARALAAACRIEDPEGSTIDPTAVARALTSLLTRLANDNPRVVVAVDDVQWLDPATATTVGFAARRLAGDGRVVFFLSRRSGCPGPPALTTRVEPRRLVLGPLSIGAIHRIVHTKTGRGMPRPALHDLYAASGGNPLHAVELARAAVERTHAGDRSLSGLFRARLDALPDTTRDAILLSALAANRSLERLARAWGGGLEDALRPAVDADLVSIAGGTVALAHPLLAQAASEAADPTVVRRAHLRLAQTSAGRLERAAHLAKGSHSPEPDAAVADELDGEAANATVRADRARLYAAAADATPPDRTEEVVRRRLRAAVAWFEAGDMLEATRLLEELEVDHPLTPQRASVLARFGVVLHESGRWSEAMTRFRLALESSSELAVVAEVRRRMAVTAGYIGSVHEGIEHAEAALQAAEAAGTEAEVIYCLATLGLAHVVAGAPGLARRYIEPALERERRSDHRLTGWTPRLVAAEQARLDLDLDGARHLYAEVLAEAVEVGDATLEHWATYGLGSTELLAGDYRKAAELAETVIELAETTGVADHYGRRLRAQVDAYRGRAGDAREQALASLRQAEARGGLLHVMAARATLGHLALAVGDSATAAAELRMARGLAAGMGFWNGVTVRSMLDECEAATLSSQLDQAAEALAAVLARLDGPPPWAQPLIARAEGLLLAARGEHDRARALLRRSAEEASASSAPLEHGRSMLALGATHRRARRAREARLALEQAVSIFDGLGAELWAATARRELARVPGRRSRRTDALTAAEQEIADRVAGGLSNRAVAGDLSVSVKTIEAALTRIYRKLGVRSRAELAARFAAGSGPRAADGGPAPEVNV